MSEPNFFAEEEFQEQLVSLLVKDPIAIREVAPFLTGEDFKPVKGSKWGTQRWIVAERALEYYLKYHEPIRKLLKSDLLDYANSMNMAERKVTELVTYASKLMLSKTAGADSIAEKTIRYKQERIRKTAIDELVALHAANELTGESWLEITQKAIVGKSIEGETTEFFSTLEDRQTRRRLGDVFHRVPSFFIEPLDSLIMGAGPGHLGLVLAPWKRGKSLFLLWLAIAFVVQRLTTLFITLEDPKAEVEDRIDAAITQLPLHNLSEKPKTLRRRFETYRRRMIRTGLHIYDGTENGISVAGIEELILRFRNRGTHFDAVIIDYDDEIIPSKTDRNGRRFEFAQIYRDLRKLAARHKTVTWTAAQTQRDTENTRILSGDKLSEDISKIRKASLALGLGKGDWGDEGIYIHVAGNKFGRQHVGCNIVSNKELLTIYDYEATRKAAAENAYQDIPNYDDD